METKRLNSDSTAAPPGYHIWEVPGKPIQIQIDLDVVDRMLLDVMRGFGAVPRRGAEVGGLLLGTSEYSDKLVVRIEDFEVIPCEYKNGPSYHLSETDLANLEAALERWKPAPEKRVYVVGYFRSHTRDGLFLAGEDVELINKHFADPSQVYLLIKPFATRVSVAGFFFQEDGEIHGESTYQEFPFRRRELQATAAPAPADRPERPAAAPDRSAPVERPRSGRLFEEIPRPGAGQPPADPETAANFLSGSGFGTSGIGGRGPRRGGPPPEPAPIPTPLSSLSSPALLDAAPPSGEIVGSKRPHFMWVPLSVVFLALGLILGFTSALLLHRQPEKPVVSDPYSLNLTVVRNGDKLELTWDPQLPAVKKALRGTLLITDGDRVTPKQLSPQDLEIGRAIYSRLSNTVVFELCVFTAENVSLTEKLELHLSGGTEPPAQNQAPVESPRRRRK